MNFRLHAFNLVDKIKGGRFRKNLEEIEHVNEKLDEKAIMRFQNERISALLEFAFETVPFYKGKSFDIHNAPVVDKMILKEKLNEFLSPKYDAEQLVKVITSGSTGTPFVSYQNKEKKYRNNADAIYFGGKAGYFLGAPLYYMKIWSSNNSKSFLTKYFQNIHTVDVLNFSGDAIRSFIDEINNSHQAININSYASALDRLCDYLDSHEVNLDNELRINSVIAQSEALSEATKMRLEKYFKIVACSRYSNVENGIVAQQTLVKNDLFKINRASYYVEILKIDEDTPAEVGELGRIVVTDLFNFGMPFIRYDTGDIGKFFVNNNGEIDRNYLAEIQGRKLDLLLNTKGEIISSYIVYKNMFKYPEINQYQLIQEDEKRYRFIISTKGNFPREDELRNDFVSYIGEDAVFEVSYIDEIPLLSSGKRRKIVNNYLKKINK